MISLSSSIPKLNLYQPTHLNDLQFQCRGGGGGARGCEHYLEIRKKNRRNIQPVADHMESIFIKLMLY